MLIGYARTSTVDQVAGLEAQQTALAATGCNKLFSEQASSVGQRGQLAAVLDYVREGDTLVVTRLDRLARSTADLLGIVATLEAKQVALRILDFGASTYIYGSGNQLSTGPGSASLIYDPLLRLYQTSASGYTTTRFAYDGMNMIAEYNSTGTLLKRHVFGPGVDEALVEYDGAGTKTYLAADERGSIIARTNASGAAVTKNSYDEYGIPGADNTGRFQYTGQAWLPELGMQYSKARIYSPTLGRFMQTDPIGYGDGMNMYAYVGNDPVNKIDPTGLRYIWACAGVGDHLNCGFQDDGTGWGGAWPDPVGPDRGSSLSGFDVLTGGGGRQNKPRPQSNQCPTGSVGDIRRNLPSKGIGSQIKDGVSSYIQGVAWGATALAARVGLLGSNAQQQAVNTNSQLGNVMGQIQSHPGQTASFVGAVASKYPAQVASRIGSGVVVSVATSPYVGVPVSGLSAYGTAFKEAYQHPDAVAAAVVVGQSCK